MTAEKDLQIKFHASFLCKLLEKDATLETVEHYVCLNMEVNTSTLF